MLFNSWGYLLFLTLAVPMYWLAPQRARMWIIVGLGLAFYGMWRWPFAALLIVSPSVDYYCGIRIGQEEDEGRRRNWLRAALAINLGLLVAFKYSYFLSDNVSAAAMLLGAEFPSLRSLRLTIVLPLGISFYTFHSLSYTLDVYRRVVQPTKRYDTFLAFVVLWPTLIAGPILRAKDIIPQLEFPRRLRLVDVSGGVQMLIFGLFKKVVIADGLAPMVDDAFSRDFHLMTAFDVWIAAFMFGLQIYYDFGGYSDIAVGSAKLLGLNFPLNFRWPYMATSPAEFWRRWHISLTSWIRDYVFIPLTSSLMRLVHGDSAAVRAPDPFRVQVVTWIWAVAIAWFIMGLWHGAAWTFVMWGMYHAALLICYRFVPGLKQLPEKAPMIAWPLTVCLIMAGWIPFRAGSVSTAIAMFAKIANPLEYTVSNRLIEGYAYLTTAALFLGMSALYELQQRAATTRSGRWMQGPAVLVSTAVAVVLVIMLMRPISQFIYFQF